MTDNTTPMQPARGWRCQHCDGPMMPDGRTYSPEHAADCWAVTTLEGNCEYCGRKITRDSPDATWTGHLAGCTEHEDPKQRRQL